MPDDLYAKHILAFAICILLVAVLALVIRHHRLECEARGGVLVRSATVWFDCVQPQRR